MKEKIQVVQHKGTGQINLGEANKETNGPALPVRAGLLNQFNNNIIVIMYNQLRQYCFFQNPVNTCSLSDGLSEASQRP